MSIWVSVYCRKWIKTIETSELVAEVKKRIGVFAYLFAQEDPEDTLSLLRVEDYLRPGAPRLLHLHYLKEGPPIVIDIVTEPDIVAGHVQEYLEYRFQDREGEQAILVREHLNTIVEIYSFCLKQRHADGMGTPLAYAASAWLAEVGDGLVRADWQGWMQRTSWGDLIIILDE